MEWRHCHWGRSSLSAIRLQEEMHDSNARERIPCHETEISSTSWSRIVAVSYILFVLDADKNKGVSEVNCGIMESDDLISNLPLGGLMSIFVSMSFHKNKHIGSDFKSNLWSIHLSSFPRKWDERTICRRGWLSSFRMPCCSQGVSDVPQV